MNGTVKGEDVWVPMDAVLGGQERCGFGWHMFVECLAEGRGVSLPAMAVALGKGVGPIVGAYSRARIQHIRAELWQGRSAGQGSRQEAVHREKTESDFWSEMGSRKTTTVLHDAGIEIQTKTPRC